MLSFRLRRGTSLKVEALPGTAIDGDFREMCVYVSSTTYICIGIPSSLVLMGRQAGR